MRFEESAFFSIVIIQWSLLWWTFSVRITSIEERAFFGVLIIPWSLLWFRLWISNVTILFYEEMYIWRKCIFWVFIIALPVLCSLTSDEKRNVWTKSIFSTVYHSIVNVLQLIASDERVWDGFFFTLSNESFHV